MHCIKQITNDLLWVGANDRRLALFEGVYSVPGGVSYNSYLLTDEKTVLFDTVDKAVQERFLENLKEGLQSRALDYLILQHIEPDHSAVIKAVIGRYPEVTLVLNEKSAVFVEQFYEVGEAAKVHIVKEGDTLSTGRHVLHFVMAPMVHWPEVMVTYDSTDKILYSADAFGSFGALNGAIFADEVDFDRDYKDEARRYYTNIVGKYGPQVQDLLKKAAPLEIEMICPLHGFVWRKNLNKIIRPYMLWSAYEPEEQGVMIAYASVYGNTENTAEILACRLRDKGIKAVMYDVSVTPASEIVSEAFKWSHLVFASTTYNAGIFVTMEALIYDLVAHNIQNRTIALIENGSWASTSGNLMQAKLEQCKNMHILGTISIKSSLKGSQLSDIDKLVYAIADTMPQKSDDTAGLRQVLEKIPYGLYLLSAKEGDKDCGCIINTVSQVSNTPVRFSAAVNKENYTHDVIMRTKEMAVSVLTESMPFSIIEAFGFVSGRDVDKFAKFEESGKKDGIYRTKNGLPYLTKYTNAMLAGKVVSTTDCGSHTIFVAELSENAVISSEASVTYKYYHEHIKPMPAKTQESQGGYICKICGYVYEGETLPEDFICPLCKHGTDDFEKR